MFCVIILLQETNVSREYTHREYTQQGENFEI